MISAQVCTAEHSKAQQCIAFGDYLGKDKIIKREVIR